MTDVTKLADRIEQAKFALDHMQDGDPEGLGPTEAVFFDLMDENCAAIVAALRSQPGTPSWPNIKLEGNCIVDDDRRITLAKFDLYNGSQEELQAVIDRANVSPAAPTTAPVAWQKLADEMIMSLGSIKLGVVDQYELRAAMLKLMKIAAAPSVAAPEDAVREAWCQPMDCGKPTPRRFMIYFDDPDHGIMVFDNEDEARAAYERKNIAWNCYLFGALPAALPAKDGAGSQVTRPNRGTEA